MTLIPGDGIGPEVSRATQRVIAAAGVSIDWEEYEVGAAMAAKSGNPLPDEVLDSVRRTKVALKGPVGTPIGKGFRSVNVTLRQALDLYANVRPVRSLPYVEPRYENVNFTIVRENTEDLYAGHEIMILPGVAQSIKVITERGSTRIAEYAFKYADRYKRPRVSAVHKANIMKMSDGLMLECTRRVAARYPHIELHEVIVDAAAMTMVRDPNRLDVIVTENLYGDILSDLGAGLVGGLGVVPGANIGDEYAVFEAVHGSAPDIAGKGVANPTALIRSAIMMLQHLGEEAAASRVALAVHAVYAARSAVTRDLGGNATTEQFTDTLCDAIENPPSVRSGALVLERRGRPGGARGALGSAGHRSSAAGRVRRAATAAGRVRRAAAAGRRCVVGPDCRPRATGGGLSFAVPCGRGALVRRCVRARGPPK
ncbi:MAG TPA: isocitrate/isopropylmalate dehydrogenase family protein [Polyangiaceae bacterium]|nr:isocitrate/isopropylmalate dehydrogenase family protein [Polyangiaceae bacterium]